MERLRALLQVSTLGVVDGLHNDTVNAMPAQDTGEAQENVCLHSMHALKAHKQ